MPTRMSTGPAAFALSMTCLSRKSVVDGMPLYLGVLFHRRLQHVHHVGHGGNHAVPARYERDAERVFHYGIRGGAHALGEGLDRYALGMPVEDKPVYGGIDLVALQHVLGRPDVCGGERAEETGREDHPLGRKRPEDGLAYVYAHLVEPFLRVFGRQGLVLVLVVVGYVHLADLADVAVAV